MSDHFKRNIYLIIYNFPSYIRSINLLAITIFFICRQFGNRLIGLGNLGFGKLWICNLGCYRLCSPVISHGDVTNGERTGKCLRQVEHIRDHFYFCIRCLCIYRVWPKVLAHVKKNLYNQPKPYFFKKLLWSNFWIDFNKFDTTTFGIVYILFVYLLIMFIRVVFICT
jgi:hypothetical protein